jgi:N-acylglucosamine 2-epimerase
MYFVVTQDGQPLRKRRYFFSESFLVVGFAEYSLVSNNKEDLALAEQYFDLMYRLYRQPETDPFKITPKENGEVRSLHSNSYPMVLVSSAQTLRRISGNKEKYDPIISSIIKDMIDLHYKEDLKVVLETVFTDGGILDNPTGRTVNPGHCIENSWFLMNHAAQTKDETLLKQALNILDWSLDRGYDEQFGGIKYFVDLYGRPCEQLEHDMKLWWVHNETLIALLTAYKLTKEEKYFSWFKKIHEYCFEKFADKEFGEWYGYLHRDGTVSHTQKGSLWKGPYHLPRCLMLCESILNSLALDEELEALL